MKKIISLVCVIAMLFSFAVTVNAADNEVTLTIKEQTADATVLSLGMKSTTTIASYTFYIDVTEAINAGATVTATIVNGSGAEYVSANKMVRVSYSPTDKTMLDAGTMELATITITALDEAYDVARVAETSRTKTEINYKADANSTAVNVTNDFTFSTDVTVAPYTPPVQYEVKDEKIADLVADTTPLVAEDGTKFTNVAKYTGSFNLTDIKNGLDIAGGEELIKVGFKKNGVADTFTSISGDGTVEYSFLFYGIADASVLDIDTYYTAKKIVVE